MLVLRQVYIYLPPTHQLSLLVYLKFLEILTLKSPITHVNPLLCQLFLLVLIMASKLPKTHCPHLLNSFLYKILLQVLNPTETLHPLLFINVIHLWSHWICWRHNLPPHPLCGIHILILPICILNVRMLPERLSLIVGLIVFTGDWWYQEQVQKKLWDNTFKRLIIFIQN